MKVKLIDKNSNLPNCWKECGTSKNDWDKLNAGNEIEVKAIPDSISSLVEVVVTSSKKKKGDK
tara:strand:+ start:432 stop:620 length:189 start_codon:yes stop_codon:yes gene_type:complete